MPKIDLLWEQGLIVQGKRPICKGFQIFILIRFVKPLFKGGRRPFSISLVWVLKYFGRPRFKY